MRSDDTNFPFGINFNFGVQTLFSVRNSDEGAPFPPVSGYMLLGDNTPMLFPDGSQMLLG